MIHSELSEKLIRPVDCRCFLRIRHPVYSMITVPEIVETVALARPSFEEHTYDHCPPQGQRGILIGHTVLLMQ